MFIREVKKQRSKDAKAFYQYNLVQTSRIDGKVKQNVILYLGSDPLQADKTNRNTDLSDQTTKKANPRAVKPLHKEKDTEPRRP